MYLLNLGVGLKEPLFGASRSHPALPAGYLIFFLSGLLFLCSLVGTLVLTMTAEAQNQIGIVHIAPSPKVLPSPGEKLSLKLNLRNTKKFDYILRALVVRDGKLFDMAVPQGTLNLQDMPEFNIELLAPREALSYQFFLYDKESVVAQSERFSVKRTCVPAMQVGAAGTGSEGEQLATHAQALDRQIRVYEVSLDLLQEIEGILANAQ